MARTSNRELYLWLVRPHGSGVKRVKVSRRFANISAVVVGVVTGLTVCIVGDYLRILVREGSNAYHIHLLIQDRIRLAQNNQDLGKQVDSLKQQNTQIANYKESVEKRLENLSSVLKSVSSFVPESDLGGDDGSRAMLALNGKGRRSSGSQNLKSLNRGLGGAEIECRRDKRGVVSCVTTSAKKDVSMKFPLNDLSKALNSPSEPKSDDLLLSQIDSITQTLKNLPIGYPVLGELSSGFGYRVSPFTHSGAIHEGIDISADRGTPIFVTGDGVVEKVDYDGQYGWMIDVLHSGNLLTRYAHLSKPLVLEGQLVTRGQKIALSGSTGRSTGPHLHYEVRVRGVAKNPMPLMALARQLETLG